MKRPAFTLLLDTRQRVAELMGECPKCGAMTTQVLKLAWDARVIACSECQTAMPVDESVLHKLRGQAADAMATIDQLTPKPAASIGL
jgi:hypothetical protein